MHKRKFTVFTQLHEENNADLIEYFDDRRERQSQIMRKTFGCFGSITICPPVFVKLKFSVKGRFNPSFTVNVSCANVYDKYRPVVKKTPHTMLMTKAATFINQLSFRIFRSKIVGKAIDSPMHGAMMNRNTPIA